MRVPLSQISIHVSLVFLFIFQLFFEIILLSQPSHVCHSSRSSQFHLSISDVLGSLGIFTSKGQKGEIRTLLVSLISLICQGFVSSKECPIQMVVVNISLPSFEVGDDWIELLKRWLIWLILLIPEMDFPLLSFGIDT